MEDEERNRIEGVCNFWQSLSNQKSVEIVSLKEKLENAERKIKDYEDANKSKCSPGEIAGGIIIAIFLIGYAGFWIGRWTTPSHTSISKWDKEQLEKLENDYVSALELTLNDMTCEAYSNGWNECYKYYRFKMKPTLKDYYNRHKK